MKSFQELMNLKGRVALITGGAGHIGMALGGALAELGAQIVVLDRRYEDCAKAVNKLESDHSIPCFPLQADLSRTEHLKSIPHEALKQVDRIDILVNCAAYVGTTDLKGWSAPFAEQDPAVFQESLRVNLTGTFALTQAFAPLLEKNGTGSVINVSSIYGVVGPDFKLYENTEMGNPAGYAAAKGGLIQLTRWLSTALPPKVRVNSLSPGGVARNQPSSFTDQYIKKAPLGRMATEEDFKGAIAYFASDLSAYVTGQNLVVDGGWTAW